MHFVHDWTPSGFYKLLILFIVQEHRASMVKLVSPPLLNRYVAIE